jgi:hypothetical protein
MATPSGSATLIATPPIDQLRLKLVQLIDQLTTLSTLLYHTTLSTATQPPSTQNPGLPSFNELLSRYNLILGHYLGMNAMLQRSSMDTGGGGRVGAEDELRKKWESSTVVPSVAVEENRDWIVGMLLRTKQVRDHLHVHLSLHLCTDAEMNVRLRRLKLISIPYKPVYRRNFWILRLILKLSRSMRNGQNRHTPRSKL